MTTDEIKRYDHDIDSLGSGRYYSKMIEVPDGEYVSFEDYQSQQKKLDEANAMLLVLVVGLESVQQLMDASYGVAGLHLNGDIAPWSELREGGRFEDRLIDFDLAISATSETAEKFIAQIKAEALREAADHLDVTPRGEFPEDQLRRMADEMEGK